MLSARCLEWKADVDSPCACCVSSVCPRVTSNCQQFLGVLPQTVSLWYQVRFVSTEKQTSSRLSRVEWTEWIVTPRCDWMLFSKHFYSDVKCTLESRLKSWTKVTLCTLCDPEWLVEVSSARMFFCKQFESDAKGTLEWLKGWNQVTLCTSSISEKLQAVSSAWVVFSKQFKSDVKSTLEWLKSWRQIK